MKFIFLIVLLINAWILLATASVSSDEACSIFGNFSAPSNSSFGDGFPESSNKTLNIIFDTTGSMWDDLDNLQAAAIEIVEKFRTYPTNPIGHYVLSQFNDPTTDLFQTTNSSEFLTALQNVPIGGGGDCPELAMEGIINALRVSQPNSFAYVFTDADALDYFRVNEVLNLVQQKQIIVNFLTTSNCFGVDSIQFQVFSIIARFSGGIVFDMFRSEVKDVMTSLSSQLESNYIPIAAYELPSGNVTVTELKIDASIGRITIAINGVNPSIEVQQGNETGNFVNVTVEYESSSFKIISFNASESFYEIITTASSDYSLRVGGTSDVKMRFGFSPDIPESFNETTAEPEWDHGNFLSIFVFDNGFIKCIYKVTITPVEVGGLEGDGGSGGAGEPVIGEPPVVGEPPAVEARPTSFVRSFKQFEVEVVTRNGNIYTTKNFTLPEGVFKIVASGFDRFGNEFVRTLSTGIGRPGSVVVPSNDPRPSEIFVIDPIWSGSFLFDDGGVPSGAEAGGDRRSDESFSSSSSSSSVGITAIDTSVEFEESSSILMGTSSSEGSIAGMPSPSSVPHPTRRSRTRHPYPAPESHSTTPYPSSELHSSATSPPPSNNDCV